MKNKIKDKTYKNEIRVYTMYQDIVGDINVEYITEILNIKINSSTSSSMTLK
jgi:hypothetical protein